MDQILIDDIHSDLQRVVEKMNRALKLGIVTEFGVPIQHGEFVLHARFIRELKVTDDRPGPDQSPS